MAVPGRSAFKNWWGQDTELCEISTALPVFSSTSDVQCLLSIIVICY